MLKASGSGNTGRGWSPKASPESQRLVGGVSPSASRGADSGPRQLGQLSTSGSTVQAGSATAHATRGRAVPAAAPASAHGDVSPPVQAAVVSATSTTTRGVRSVVLGRHRTPTRWRNSRSSSVGPARMPSSAAASASRRPVSRAGRTWRTRPSAARARRPGQWRRRFVPEVVGSGGPREQRPCEFRTSSILWRSLAATRRREHHQEVRTPAALTAESAATGSHVAPSERSHGAAGAFSRPVAASAERGQSLIARRPIGVNKCAPAEGQGDSGPIASAPASPGVQPRASARLRANSASRPDAAC